MLRQINFTTLFSNVSAMVLHAFFAIVFTVACSVPAHAQRQSKADARPPGDEHAKRYNRGLKHLQTLDRHAMAKLEKQLKDVAPEMIDHIVAFGYGDVYADERLDPLSRQVATIAALTALGNAAPQLRFHIDAALNLGMAPEAIVEVIYITTVFAGFPAGLNGVAVLGQAFDVRGIKMAPVQPREGSRRERGLAAVSATSNASGQAVLDSLEDVAPDLGTFILDFAYGDIISRDVISPQWKEITMIAAAAARGTMAPQLAVHLHAALNVGCSKAQIAEVIKQMAVYAGFPAALNAAFEFKRVLAQRTDTPK